jgi:hypothetical protein
MLDSGSELLEGTVVTVLVGFMVFLLRYLLELRKLDVATHQQYTSAIDANTRAVGEQTRSLEMHSMQIEKLTRAVLLAERNRGEDGIDRTLQGL